MAHVQKIKQGSVAPLVAHYERKPELERGFVRGNIDPERIGLNYNLRPSDVRQEVGLAIAQHEQTSGKGIRKDANVLLDWVVTLPQDCPAERSREFFEATAEFMEGRYGKENVLGCYVHMDETTPHAHVPILPMRDGKLVASQVVDRRDLQTFHGDLGKHVDAALGMHVSIELDERQRGERQLSRLTQDEYVAAKQRLECLRQEIEDIQPAAVGIGESARILFQNRGAGAREEALAGEVERLRAAVEEREGEIGECEAEAGRCTCRAREVEGDTRRIERGIERLERSVEAARGVLGRLNRRMQDTVGYLSNVGERAAALLQSLGVKAFAGAPQAAAGRRSAAVEPPPKRSPRLSSVAEDARRASRAAEAYNRHQSRGQGRYRGR